MQEADARAQNQFPQRRSGFGHLPRKRKPINSRRPRRTSRHVFRYAFSNEKEAEKDLKLASDSGRPFGAALEANIDPKWHKFVPPRAPNSRPGGPKAGGEYKKQMQEPKTSFPKRRSGSGHLPRTGNPINSRCPIRTSCHGFWHAFSAKMRPGTQERCWAPAKERKANQLKVSKAHLSPSDSALLFKRK